MTYKLEVIAGKHQLGSGHLASQAVVHRLDDHAARQLRFREILALAESSQVPADPCWQHDADLLIVLAVETRPPALAQLATDLGACFAADSVSCQSVTSGRR